MQQSSSERDSIGSRDTGIDLNPDDVPTGYHPSVDRLLAHRRRSRSVAPSRSAAADTAPRVIDADDETDDPSVVGKDAAPPSSRRSTSRSASFDKTMEWLMTRTGSKCPPAQFPGAHNGSLSCSSSQLYDTLGCDDATAATDTQIQADTERNEMTPLEDCHCRPDSPSQSSSASRSVCPPQSLCDDDDDDDDDHRLAMSSDVLNLGLHRRVVDGCAAAAEHVASSDVAGPRHQLQVQASRQSSVDSEVGVRNTRRSKQKVSLS